MDPSAGNSMSTGSASLKPRKSPVQARSTATVETLHAAAFQVLIREGLARCTTSRIAARAGTSVGSLYQYYPNRDALLAAILEKHLDAVAVAVEEACRGHRGKGVAEMASALVRAFLSVKLRDPEESKALYAVAHDRGGAALAVRLRKRMVTASAALLASASDVRIDDPTTTATFALGAMVGPIQILLEGRAPTIFRARLEPELIAVVTAYLRTHERRDR
jgi:AcrR family transcriptional regulator